MRIAMKNLVLAVSVMTVGTVAAKAQQTVITAAGAVTNASGPRIQFATPMYDFGRVKSGEPVNYTYVFTNTGDRLLVLNSVQPQCGCTAAGEWTRQVEPGKTGSIPIKFNTMGYNGPVFKQVTVNCNATNQAMLYLQFKGSVYKPIDVTPGFAFLNVPADAESASMVVTITNNTEEPLILSPPESNNRMFSAQLTNPVPGKKYLLTVSIVPPLAAGSAQGQISLKTSWTNTPVLHVTASANVQPAVMVIPPYIALPPGPLLNAVTNTVTIQNNSTNRLELSEPVVNAPGVEAQIRETQPGKQFAAMVAFPQGFQAPLNQQIELSVKTSNAKFPVVKARVLQVARPAAPALPAPAPAPTVAPVAPAKQLPGGPIPAPVKRVSAATTKAPVELPPLPPGL
jgi:hypothetical protein